MNTVQIIAAVTALATLVAAIFGAEAFTQRALERQMDAFRNEITKQMEAFRNEIKAEMGGLRADVRAEVAPVRADVGHLKTDVEQIKRQIETIFGKMVLPK